jgi:hypothetical protein
MLVSDCHAGSSAPVRKNRDLFPVKIRRKSGADFAA